MVDNLFYIMKSYLQWHYVIVLNQNIGKNKIVFIMIPNLIANFILENQRNCLIISLYAVLSKIIKLFIFLKLKMKFMSFK